MTDGARNLEKIEIKPMAQDDLDEVLTIERDSFSCPWSRESFEYELANRELSVPLLAKIGASVVGYSLAWFVADEIYIANIAVHCSYRRRGIAELLLRTLLEKAYVKGCRLATLEVRETNEPALALYGKFGFWAVAVRKGYYRDTGENAIVMIKDLGPYVPHRPERCVRADTPLGKMEWSGSKR